MKLLTYTCLLSIMLTSCVAHPVQTLSQKLEGKTPEEKHEILRIACLNEAEYSTNQKKAQYQLRYGLKRSHLVRDTNETIRFKTLCREMTAASIIEKQEQ